MTDTLLLLPSDIVLEVFSYLTQADVVECMLVSRKWQSDVPKFTIDLWRQITVSRASWPKTNDRMLRCLGMHVKEVFIDNFNTKDVLAKLKEHGCQLVQLASRLSPFDFLAQFPNLTHFTLLLNDPIPEYKSPPKTKMLCNKLKYLHLDINLNLEQAIVPVLEECPQLAILLLSHFGIPPVDTPDDFDSIFNLCPHLTHLLLNEQISKDVYNDPVVNEWSAVPTNSKSNGLQQIIFRGHGAFVKTLQPILKKHCKELERLQLYCEVNILSHLSFPKLKKVSFRGVAMVDDEFKTLFQSFKAIESLDLVMTEASQMAILGEYIASWEHLRQIKLNSLAEPADDNEANEWNKTTFLADTRIEQLEFTGSAKITDAGVKAFIRGAGPVWSHSVRALAVAQTRNRQQNRTTAKNTARRPKVDR
ncbi:hypothetical protein BJV82DRAFT_584149 [Fennellomyces sp. T-0311]|nr:hypothetical protein BJV82DRAFT_584149 [Fennellomyces sp. T-0311]